MLTSGGPFYSVLYWMQSTQQFLHSHYKSADGWLDGKQQTSCHSTE